MYHPPQVKNLHPEMGIIKYDGVAVQWKKYEGSEFANTPGFC